MLIELLSMSNYGHFNIKLAHILGLNTAVYLNQLMDINEKAIRKNKLVANFFILDREYVTSRTTLSEKEQKEIESNLVKLGILERSKEDDNSLLLNIAVLTNIMMSPDEDLVKDIKNFATKSKKTKSEKIIENLKNNIITLNPELRTAYYNWIDAVYEKDGFMNKQAVISAQSNIDNFSNRNLDVALKVLEIATLNGYRDVTWAINSYNKDYKVTYVVNTENKTINNTSPSSTSAVVAKKRLSNAIF